MGTTSRLIPSRSDPSPSNNINDARGSSGSGSTSSSIYAAADAAAAVSNSVHEVWKEIGSDHKLGGEGEDSCARHHHTMTLEDYLAKEGIVREEEVEHEHKKQQHKQSKVGMEGSDSMKGLAMESVHAQPPTPLLGYGSGRRCGRKRTAPEEPAVDKAAQQKQRRMIKNRESAARSRERKQAYTMDLEAMVTNLEEERAGLLREQEERQKKRLEEIMRAVLTTERRPQLRRTLSV